VKLCQSVTQKNGTSESEENLTEIQKILGNK